MKLTSKKLKQIIKEELRKILREGQTQYSNFPQKIEAYLYQRMSAKIPDPKNPNLMGSNTEDIMDAIAKDTIAKIAYDRLKGSRGKVDDQSYGKVAQSLLDKFQGGGLSQEIRREIDNKQNRWLKTYKASGQDRHAMNKAALGRQTRDDLDPSQYQHKDYDPYADGD